MIDLDLPMAAIHMDLLSLVSRRDQVESGRHLTLMAGGCSDLLHAFTTRRYQPWGLRDSKASIFITSRLPVLSI